MENKLQELTQKLYDEGLSKGRQQSEALIADAKAQAKRIVDEARAEAERIGREAAVSAEDLQKNTLTELNLAGKQVITTLKSQIQDMIIAKTVSGQVSDAVADPQFVKEMLLTVAKNWQGAGDENISLTAMLPEEMKGRLEAGFEESVKKELGKEVELTYSDGVKSGFRIGPKNGGYYISFTDESFDALLGEYLRPKVNELLYGKDE